ncbi:MAG: ribosome silencing factor [Chloroflexi bacterium]|jgi:ribosome-associated protein|nr:ribosome silencing factor [Chloroflexota bacterium]MBT7080308.1 ribosome silencing factor [Chloroflexota bacterium]MBT7289997.1 ribosome silencing factor [Chloroflexota bacterium]
MLEPIEIARKIVDIASDKMASDILMLDITEIGFFADYFVICSGQSQRQIGAIAQEIDKVMRKDGIKVHHKESTASSGWILMDYGSTIVHIFDVETREYYDLEQLWEQAKPVVRIQ